MSVNQSRKKNICSNIKLAPLAETELFFYKNGKAYTDENFKKAVYEYFKSFRSILEKSGAIKKLGLIIGKGFEREFKRFFIQITQNFSYKELPSTKRSPKHICASIVYTIMEVHCDISDLMLSKKGFSEIINLNYKKFTHHLKYYKRNFFSIDEGSYFRKILKYYDLLIKEINKAYKLGLTEAEIMLLKQRIVNLYNFLKNINIYIPHDILCKLYSADRDIYKTLEKHGLDINNLFKLGRYNSFMPQYTALILIYFHKDTEEIKAKKNLSYIDLAKLAGYPEKRIGRLATILRFSVQIKQNKQLCQVKYYPEEYFIKDLESAYNKTHRLDFLLLLKLYKLSGLNPNEFAKNIISRKCRKNNYYLAHPLINLIKKYSLSTVSYEKIRDKFQLLHDQHRISDSQLKKAFALINLADNVKSIPLIHNSVKYSFRFNEANLYQINDYGLKEKIAEHFTKIKKGNYPQEIFNDRWITRASILYLSGTNKERLLTDTIKNLIKQLNSVRLIGKVKTGFIYTFTEEARKIHDRYGKKYGTRPNHPPILNNMIRKNHIMGIEVPLWAQTQGGEYVTGHIDLLAYYKNKVIIGDYKPTEREIFRSLPQICVYAYMLRERLQLKDFENVICVSYSKDVAWAFKPQILEGILKFIEKENSRRTENLKCKRCWKGLPLKDLAQEIAKIIM